MNDLKENLTDLVIVANGKLTVAGWRCFASLTPYVYVRENIGFDVGAWKDTMLNYLGWDKIAQYDELILVNDTFYGPLYPFRETFEKMDRCPGDFWGLTAHGAVESSLYSYTPEHVQSFFVVIRKSMHTSYEFQQYWEKQPFYQAVTEVIKYHECTFTKYFSNMGFTWSVLSDTADLDGEYCDNGAVCHCYLNTYELIKNRRCPVMKRHCFGFEYAVHLNVGNGSQLRASMEYIANETSYDISLIYKNVLRVYNVADIFYNLHLQFILPKEYRMEENPTSQYRAVMVFHISYMDKLDYLTTYISEVPENVDVILTTKPKKNLDIVYRHFSPILGDRLRVILAKDPGRDLSALLVAASPYLKKYDYIGFCHDKGPHKGEPVTWSRDFQELIIENIIGSSAYIENVIDLLDKHPEIGFLSPPPPHHASAFGAFGNFGWSCYDNIEQIKKLSKKLKLNVDISAEKWSIALGTAFWCRREALAPLLDYPWDYNDFPPEPLALDGTLNHALERIFPFVAQDQGYLSGWVMTDEYAALEINNMHYRVDQVLHSGAAPGSLPTPIIRNEPNIGLKGALIIYVKKHLPKPLWGIAKKIKHLLHW